MKTVIEMARSVGATAYTNRHYPDRPTHTFNVDQLQAFAELVRADERNRTWTQEHWTEYERSIVEAERKACANLVFHSPPSDEYESPLVAVYNAIRARSNT